MYLLIDSGNSFIKWGMVIDESFIIEGQCPTAAVSSLQEKWAGCDAPTQVIVSNVAGEDVAAEIRKRVTALWQLDTRFLLSSQSCCGLTNSYYKPEQLGVDRWMAMVGAYHAVQDPLIVIDCGTAVTIDLVNEKGVFVGGVIMPGLNTAFQSLRAETDAVDEINNIISDVSPVAQSTEEGVAAGVVLGLAGGIERVLREQSSQTGKTPAVFLTGGDAEKLMPYLAMAVDYQANLVLQGLRIVALQRLKNKD